MKLKHFNTCGSHHHTTSVYMRVPGGGAVFCSRHVTLPLRKALATGNHEVIRTMKGM